MQSQNLQEHVRGLCIEHATGPGWSLRLRCLQLRCLEVVISPSRPTVGATPKGQMIQFDQHQRYEDIAQAWTTEWQYCTRGRQERRTVDTVIVTGFRSHDYGDPRSLLMRKQIHCDVQVLQQPSGWSVEKHLHELQASAVYISIMTALYITTGVGITKTMPFFL